MPQLFQNFIRNIVKVFSGKNLLWHALAILLTILIVTSDFDWSYYVWTRSAIMTDIAFPAVMLGTSLPILIPLILLLIGMIQKKAQAVANAWAIGQAAILGSLISSFYKAFTGRIPPPMSHGFIFSTANPMLADSSHGFQFGFFKGGIFWGWPSSHTTIAFAMAACMVMLYPKNKKVIFFSLLYALYVGLGVSVTIHWFSEFVAGAIIGSVIGVVVGRSFRKV